MKNFVTEKKKKKTIQGRQKRQNGWGEKGDAKEKRLNKEKWETEEENKGVKKTVEKKNIE